MGLLGLIGALYDQAGTDHSPGYLTRVSNQIHPDIAAGNMQNQTEQSALAKLADMGQSGVNDPQQLLAGLATVNPDYTMKAAALQAQNPLAALLRPSGNGTSPNMNLTGEDFLKTLPPSVAGQIKGYAEGKIQPSPYLMRTPAGQQMMQLVSQYDPSFDASNYAARAATRKDFTSGKSAQNITALNTAMGHLASLSDAYNNLNSGGIEGNTSIPAWNAVKNYVGNALGDENIQKNTADVGAKAHAVSEELAKVFRSTGMAESDVKAWENKISTNASPAQSKAIIDSAIELANSRLDALGQQYNQGMGTTKQGIELLSPAAQAAYKKLTGTDAPRTAVTGNMAADNTANDPVAKAKSLGYTDDEIQAYLAKKKGGK